MENAMSDVVSMAVLLSGSGRTLQNFLDKSEDGSLKANVTGVLSSRSDAYGLQRAADANIPAEVVLRKDFENTADFSSAITEVLSGWEPDLIAMAGFMCFYEIPPMYRHRVMNIHPALLPSFGGEGFYGERVHRAVLEYGCKVSGCTVHFADNMYDNGPIIVQRTVSVREDDDEHSLADRVFEQEKIAYPQAINLFAEGRLKVEGRRVRII
jgi:formyltetrahydrofolate-dependent phosphoribosylglycinamide formyltransferase